MLVFDFGGGTLDVTIMEISGMSFKVLPSDRERESERERERERERDAGDRRNMY